MSEHKSYRHELTGKVGQYSDAVAKLFPHLKPVSEAPMPIAEPVVEKAPIVEPKAARKDKKEVAV